MSAHIPQHGFGSAEERVLFADADRRALRYLDGIGTRRVFPDQPAIDAG